jgi:hypothetical protein
MGRPATSLLTLKTGGFGQHRGNCRITQRLTHIHFLRNHFFFQQETAKAFPA